MRPDEPIPAESRLSIAEGVGAALSSFAPPLTDDDILGVSADAVLGVILQKLPRGRVLPVDGSWIFALSAKAAIAANPGKAASSQRLRSMRDDPAGALIWFYLWLSDARDIVGKARAVLHFGIKPADCVAAEHLRLSLFGDRRPMELQEIEQGLESFMARAATLEHVRKNFGMASALAPWEELVEDLMHLDDPEASRDLSPEQRDDLARGWVDRVASSDPWRLLYVGREGRIRIGYRQVREKFGLRQRRASEKSKPGFVFMVDLDSVPASADDEVLARDARAAMQAALAARLARTPKGTSKAIVLRHALEIIDGTLTMSDLGGRYGKSPSALSEAWAETKRELRAELRTYEDPD
jgi:hypothetical protein